MSELSRLLEMEKRSTEFQSSLLKTTSVLVFPLSKSLFEIVNKIHQMINSGKLGSTVKQNSLVTSSAGSAKTLQEKPFDAMNNIVANLLLNLTR